MEESASQGIELKNDIERKLLGFAKVIENEQEVVIEEEIKKAVRQAQRMKSDIFGFGQALHNKYQRSGKRLKKIGMIRFFRKLSLKFMCKPLSAE